MVSDAYSKARHFLGQADEPIMPGAAVHKVAAPLVAAGMDAYAGDEAKAVAKTRKSNRPRLGKIRYGEKGREGRW